MVGLNDAKTHSFKVGELVEIDHGVRLFVALQTRDCDGTPIYCLTPKKDDYTQNTKGFANHNWLNGWSEDSMKMVKSKREEQLENELADKDRQLQCELEHKKKLSDCANAGITANERLFDQLSEARAEIERLKTELRYREMMAMLKRTTLAIKYIRDGAIQCNSMLNVLLIESVELIKKMEARNERYP